MERNYQIYDRELLAIIRALEAWRHFLQGSPHSVEVISDHKNLTYFRSAQKLNRRQARWHLFLTEFNITIKHQAGKTLTQADALSRRPGHDEGENDNKDVIVLEDKLFAKSNSAAPINETTSEISQIKLEKEKEFIVKAVNIEL